MEGWESHISSDPNIMFGKPVVTNTRVSVDLILEKLGNKYTFEDILAAYPRVSIEDIHACLLYAAECVKNERVLVTAS
jgi:uncharacterized protein (DUF433 family)